MVIILFCLLAMIQPFAHPLLGETIGTDPSRFPEEAIPITQLKARSEYLKACYHEKAWELSYKINRQFKKYIKKQSHDFSQNASRHRLPYVPREDFSASDVHIGNDGRYVLFGCPRSGTEAACLFDACMLHDVTLFVSLLESTEAEDKFNNYWQEHNLSQIRTHGGWTFSKSSSRVLREGDLEADGINKPQIIETTIIATNRSGARKKLTHLHYEGWRDKEAMPSEKLFHFLIKYIGKLQKGKKGEPIAINCHGGVGRTGTLALTYFLKNEIDDKLAHGLLPDDIFINVPDLLFAFRLQRNYFLQQAPQLANLYSVLGDYVGKKTGVKRPLDGVKMPSCHDNELFIEETCRLKDLRKKIEALKQGDSQGFELLSDKISLKFNQFLERTRKEGNSHNFNATLTSKRMTDRPAKEYLNANDITIGASSYLLFACPNTIEEVATLFDAALQKDTTLFVSMLKSTDASDRVNNFWEGRHVDQIKTVDGWTITHNASHIHKNDKELPRIIETTLIAERGDVKKTITHLHYDGWEQDQEIPNIVQYGRFLDRIEQLHKGSQAPIAVHSKWGVGRSGVTILSLYLRDFVRQQIKQGVKAKEIEVSIAKLIFELRKQRNGFIEHAPLLESTYDALLHFYDTLG